MAMQYGHYVFAVPTDFSPTEPPDHHHKDRHLSPLHPPSPHPHPPSLHPPSRPSATLSQQHPYSSRDPKLHPPPSSRTDMSTTRHGEQASKRSPQPKAEVSTSCMSKGSSRGNNTAMSSSSSAERNRNDQVRGNQGAGLEPAPTGGGGAEKKRAKTARKVVDSNNQKNRSRDLGVVKTPPPSSAPAGGCDVGVVKTPPPTTANVSSATPRLPLNAVSTRVSPPTTSTRTASTRGASPTAPVATRGVASDTTPLKPETSESKTNVQSHSTRGKKQSSRGHRLSHTPLETSHRHPRDPSPSSSSVGSSTHDNSSSSNTNTKTTADSGWAKPIYSNSPSDKQLHTTTTTTTPTTTPPTSDNPSTNQKPGLENKEDFLWSASQESDTGDWGNDVVDLEDQLLWSSSTDDDKIIYSEWHS